jgi:hypothetical protein
MVTSRSVERRSSPSSASFTCLISIIHQPFKRIRQDETKTQGEFRKYEAGLLELVIVRPDNEGEE